MNIKDILNDENTTITLIERATQSWIPIELPACMPFSFMSQLVPMKPSFYGNPIPPLAQLIDEMIVHSQNF